MLSEVDPRIPWDKNEVAPGGYYYQPMGPGNPPELRKRDWTWDDVKYRCEDPNCPPEDRWKRVTFYPNKSTWVMWQGLKLYCQAGLETTWPEPFFKVYKDSVEQAQEADKLARKLFATYVGDPHGPGEGGLYDPGAGALAVGE